MGSLVLASAQPAQAKSGGYDIPTGAPRSPLFGALPFTQKMLMFEEFGTRNVPATEAAAGKRRTRSAIDRDTCFNN